MVIKMKKFNKVVIVLIIIFFVGSVFNEVHALGNLNKYKPTIKTDDLTVRNMANKIIGGFKAVGTIISVIALIIIGLKYMFSSVEERAANKESLIIYFIGAVLVFGISNITQVIYNWAINIKG